MPSPHQLRLAALAAILALAAACSDSSTGPSDLQPADLSQALTELQLTALAPLNSATSVAPVAGLAAPAPSSCSYDGVSKSFVCPTVSVNNVTVSRSFTLLDASGTPQAAFDKSTTAAVRMKTAFAGTLTTSDASVVIDQEQDITLSGLQTGVHTLNGTSLGHLTGHAGAGAATVPIATTISTAITSLVLPRSSSGSQWPQSGTIAATITDSSSGTPLTAAITITFNGTSKALVSVTANGVTLTSTIDLANPGSVRG
jgi:hypothetical protein